jgi:hypothetical protein
MLMLREKNTWNSVKRLALDEIAMRKGHQDFVTVVGDIERGFTRSYRLPSQRRHDRSLAAAAD